MQIAKLIYSKSLDTMKKILDLGGFKLDKRTKDYQYFKSEVMDYTYDNLRKLFKQLSDNGIIEKCKCGRNSVRQGYKACTCGGSGWINVIKKDK